MAREKSIWQASIEQQTGRHGTWADGSGVHADIRKRTRIHSTRKAPRFGCYHFCLSRLGHDHRCSNTTKKMTAQRIVCLK